MEKQIKWLLLILFLFSQLFPNTGLAKIDFGQLSSDKVDVNKLKVEKEKYFSFLEELIYEKKPGLGQYKSIKLNSCFYPVNGQRFYDLKNMSGRDIKYLSNPDCESIILGKLIKNSYKGKKSVLNSSGARRCVKSLKRILSPMMEYYSLKYEESKLGKLSNIEFEQKKRLNKIIKFRERIEKYCEPVGVKSVLKFLTDLDAVIESSYRKKSRK